MIKIIVALVLLALFGIVGAIDYEDAKAEEERYCEMVKAGHWPDYRRAFLSECRPPTSAPR